MWSDQNQGIEHTDLSAELNQVTKPNHTNCRIGAIRSFPYDDNATWSGLQGAQLSNNACEKCNWEYH